MAAHLLSALVLAAGVALIAAPTPSLANTTTGLVAHYPLDGDALDHSGLSRHGTLHGDVSPGSDRFGNPSGAMSFDGDGDFIRASATGLPAAERTVALWFRADSLNGYPAPFGYGGDGCGTSWFMVLNPAASGTIALGGHCGIGDLAYPYVDAPVGVWHHWAATTGPLGTRMYLDGNLVASNEVFVNWTVADGKDLALGVMTSVFGSAPYTDGNVGYFSGRLDDVRVYERTLSAAEVRELAGRAFAFEYWVPYVETAHPGPSATDRYLEVLAFEDGTTVDVNGVQVVLDAGQMHVVGAPDLREGMLVAANHRLSVRYVHISHDFGSYEDGGLGYTVPELSDLGTEFWIPTPNSQVNVLAPLADAQVRSSVEGVSQVAVVGNVLKLFGLPPGTRLVSDQPVSVVVSHYAPDFYDDTYAYELVPANAIGSSYQVPRSSPYSFQSPEDSSGLYLLATDHDVTANVDGTPQPLTAGVPVRVPITAGGAIDADGPLYAVFVNQVEAVDPWASVPRVYAYGIGLVPRERALTEALLFPHGELGLASASTETTTVVLQAETTGSIPVSIRVAPGEQRYVGAGDVPGWGTAAMRIRACPGVLVTEVLRTSWVGVNDHCMGWAVYGINTPTVGVVSRPAVHGVAMEVGPNPFLPGRGHARVGFGAPGEALVSLRIHSVSGRLLRLLDPAQPASRLTWDGRDAADHPVPAGIYYWRAVTADGRTSAGRIAVLR